MDKDRVAGETKDVKGRMERQAGEWTGDKDAQSKGARDQAEGKAQNLWGRAKDAARDAADDMEGKDGERRRKDDSAA